jgi:ankyrin repeat protein
MIKNLKFKYALNNSSALNSGNASNVSNASRAVNASVVSSASMLHKGFTSFLMMLIISFAFVAQAAQVDDLWLYVKNDRVEEVGELLVEKKLDPNTVNTIGTPLLMQTVRDGSWRVFDLVLSQPATDVNKTNGYVETPIMYLSLVGDLPRVKQVRTKGAELNQNGWTALHYAAVKGHADIVKYLLAEGALPNALSPNGTTALMMAMSNNHEEVVQLLLNAGANPYIVDANANTAISEGKDRGNTKLVGALKTWMLKHPESSFKP